MNMALPALFRVPPSSTVSLFAIVAAVSGQFLVAQESSPTGALDPTFQSHIDRGRVETVVAQPDGRLFVGGNFAVAGFGANLMRFSKDGAPDSAFAPTSGVPWLVTKLALQPAGKVLGGNKGGIDGGYPSIGLSRFLADGTKDSSFAFRLPDNLIGSGVWSGFWTTALALQPDGKLLLAGHYERDHLDYWYWSVVSLRRLLEDGSDDATFTFTWPTPQSIQGLILLPDQRLLVAGDQLIRLNADGSEDKSFVRTILPAGHIKCCIPQPDGKVLVGGTFTGLQGQARCRVARLLADGQLDLSFSPPVSTRDYNPDQTEIGALAVQPDGRILVGGNFETINGLPYVALARLNPDGSLDMTFPPILSLDEDGDVVEVRSILIQDETRALIGGERLLPSGASDVTALFRVHLGELLPRLSILQISANAVRLSFNNPGRHDYTVLRSTNPTLPTPTWTVLGSPTNVSGDLFQFTDRLSTSTAHSFYRLRRVAGR